MYSLLDISGSGMTANKTWLETIGNNITNMQTTRTEEGGPYRRQIVTLSEKREFNNIIENNVGKGVEVTSILQDPNVRLVYDPRHPDAGEDGYVEFPEINITAEMTDLLMAQRGFEASSTALDVTKKTMQKTLEIGK